ncbi:MAG: hypothetical protein BJ554DRAFT_2391 [Olpidium bornovanus]|uniref:Protein HGH1 homolog n=1 Tax=Olpidium bornovanus TaxID=278681 RepID=A0A8H7ZQB7_9FUNG|nr:MAG: hypothetical protein BJ554DRAFT_2391 [Olpidium bornovanus]
MSTVRFGESLLTGFDAAGSYICLLRFHADVRRPRRSRSSRHFKLAQIPKGREYFLNPSYDGQLPLAKIVCFTEHPSIIRRGGADTVLKNCCFDADKHETILDEGKINALPYILLPLCGPEEFDDEDTEGMPEDRREVDPHLRLTLIEALLLLTTSRMGRDTLRKRKVYPIVRTLHLAEKDEKVIEIAENLVNMLIRDEAGGAAPGKEAEHYHDGVEECKTVLQRELATLRAEKSATAQEVQDRRNAVAELLGAKTNNAKTLNGFIDELEMAARRAGFNSEETLDLVANCLTGQAAVL